MGAGYGLLGPTPYQPKPSIVDRVAARLFPTGAYQGILDPSQTQQLGRQGLFNVGLNLLQAGGRQPMQHGTLANIGAAIQGTNFPEMAAQAIAAQNYRAKQQQTAAIRQTVTANAPQAGDAPDAIYQKLATMIGQLAGLPGAEDLIGKLAPALKDLKPTAPDRARWSFQTIQENGEPVLYRINEDTGVKYRIGLGRPAAGAAGGVTAMETRAAAQNALAALNQADAVLQRDPNADILPTGAALARGAKAHGGIIGLLGGAAEPLAQQAMSATQQEFQQAMDQFLHNYASVLPRGGRSVAILQNLRNSFAPTAGQTEPQVRAAFAAARANLRATLEALANGQTPKEALPDGTPPPATPRVAAPGYSPKFWHP